MAKFKVGNHVTILLPTTFSEKGDNLVAHILEVNTQTCEAGVEQVSYVVRVWAMHRDKSAAMMNVITFREMELGEKVEGKVK